MEDKGFFSVEVIIYILFAAGYVVLKIFGAAKRGSNSADEYEVEMDQDGKLVDDYTRGIEVEEIKPRVVVNQSKDTKIEQEKTVTISAHEYDYNRHGDEQVADDSFDIEDFDLRKAVIMSEILQPKFKSEE